MSRRGEAYRPDYDRDRNYRRRPDDHPGLDRPLGEYGGRDRDDRPPPRRDAREERDSGWNRDRRPLHDDRSRDWDRRNDRRPGPSHYGAGPSRRRTPSPPRSYRDDREAYQIKRDRSPQGYRGDPGPAPRSRSPSRSSSMGPRAPLAMKPASRAVSPGLESGEIKSARLAAASSGTFTPFDRPARSPLEPGEQPETPSTGNYLPPAGPSHPDRRLPTFDRQPGRERSPPSYSRTEDIPRGPRSDNFRRRSPPASERRQIPPNGPRGAAYSNRAREDSSQSRYAGDQGGRGRAIATSAKEQAHGSRGGGGRTRPPPPPEEDPNTIVVKEAPTQVTTREDGKPRIQYGSWGTPPRSPEREPSPRAWANTTRQERPMSDPRGSWGEHKTARASPHGQVHGRSETWSTRKEEAESRGGRDETWPGRAGEVKGHASPAVSTWSDGKTPIPAQPRPAPNETKEGWGTPSGDGWGSSTAVASTSTEKSPNHNEGWGTAGSSSDWSQGPRGRGRGREDRPSRGRGLYASGATRGAHRGGFEGSRSNPLLVPPRATDMGPATLQSPVKEFPKPTISLCPEIHARIRELRLKRLGPLDEEYHKAAKLARRSLREVEQLELEAKFVNLLRQIRREQLNALNEFGSDVMMAV